jgi:hypothetical protein
MLLQEAPCAQGALAERFVDAAALFLPVLAARRVTGSWSPNPIARAKRSAPSP